MDVVVVTALLVLLAGFAGYCPAPDGFTAGFDAAGGAEGVAHGVADGLAAAGG